MPQQLRRYSTSLYIMCCIVLALVLFAALLEYSTDCQLNTHVERTWGCEH